MAATVGLEQKASLEYEGANRWGLGPLTPGAAEIELMLEGNGAQFTTERSWVPIIANVKSPAHGVASQHAVGQNITGNINFVLTTVNKTLLTNKFVERTAATGKLDSFSFYFDKGPANFGYNGCKVNTCEISAAPGDFARMTWDVIAKEQVAAAIAPVVPTSVGNFFPHWASSFSWGGTALTTIENWSVSINNNLVAGPHNASNLTFDKAVISYLEETTQDVTGSFTVLWDPSILNWNTDLIATTEVPRALLITLRDGTIGGTTIVISVPQAYVSAAPEEGGMGDLLKVTVNWQAAYNASGDIILFT